MLGVPAAANADPVVSAGPLQVRVTAAGEIRVGWDEPDWLGPARLSIAGAPVHAGVTAPANAVQFDAGWLQGEIAALPGEPVVVLRLQAHEQRAALGTGDFATPCVAWHFDPARRGPAPGRPADSGLSAISTRSSRSRSSATRRCSRWRLLPFRPAVVLPLGLVAPDGRTLLLAPLDAVPRAGDRAFPSGKEQAGAGLRAGWHGDLDDVSTRASRPSSRSSPATARATATTRWARLLRCRSGVAAPRVRHRHARHAVSYWTDNGSAYWYRTEPGLDARLDGRRRGRRSRSARDRRSARCSSTRGGTRTRCCARSTPTSGSCRRRAWCCGSRAPTCCRTASPRCASGSAAVR